MMLAAFSFVLEEPMATRRRPRRASRPDLHGMACRLSEIASLFTVATRSLDVLDMHNARPDEVNALRAGLKALDEFREALDHAAMR